MWNNPYVRGRGAYGIFGNQLVTVSCEFTWDTDWFTGNITFRNQTWSKQISNPFRIFGIIHITYYGFYPFRVSNGDTNIVFQKVQSRNSIFIGRFYTDIATFIFNRSIFELQNRIVKSGETLLLIRRFNSGSRFNDCGNEKRFVDIDAATGLRNNVHSQKLSKQDKEAIGCFIKYLTEKLKQFLMCGLIEPLICDWKMKLILITMLSKIEKSLYNSPFVFCNIASLRIIL